MIPAFLTSQQAEQAFRAFVLPAILASMEDNHLKRKHLHIVSLIPNISYEEGAPLPILFQHSIGNKKDWEFPYDKYAFAKARLSWRTGLSSREVVLGKPYLLISGDCRYWGSSVHGGIISAASGVQPYFDEMFATMTSAGLMAEAAYYADLLSQNPEAPDFL